MTKEKRKKLTKEEKLAQYNQKLDAGFTPIEEILKENEQKEEISKIVSEKEQKSDEPGAIRNFLGGLFSSLATTATDLGTLGEGYLRASHNLGRAAVDPDYSAKQALVEALTENKNLQASAKIDEGLRNLMGLKQQEDLSGSEQLASMSGELVPILASGGSKGLVKLGTKLQKQALKSAKKKAIVAKKALTAKEISDIKNKVDLGTGLLLPGVQITKGASKGQQAVELATQAGIPLGINEAVRASSDQEGIFGDYTPIENQDISLITDKRKIKGKDFVEDLSEGVIENYTLDNIAAEEQNKSNTLATTAAVGGAILGSAAATRKLKKLFNKETAESLKQTNSADFVENLDVSTRLDMTAADRFAFKNKAVDEGLLSKETANELAQDMHSKINSAFVTGNLGDGIELSFSPQATYDKLRTLKLTDATNYKRFELFLELNSLLQDETNRFNKYFKNGTTDYSPDEYLTKQLSGELENIDTVNYTDAKYLAKQARLRKVLLTQINNNPQTKQLLQEVSEIGNALLKKMEKSGIYSLSEIEELRKNRTVDNLFLYKPRVLNNNQSIRKRLMNYLIEKIPFDKNKANDRIYRGENFINKSKDYLDVFESNFKQTLQDIHDNNIIKKSMKEMEAGSLAKINKELDTFDSELIRKTEEFMDRGQKFNAKNLVNSYQKQIQELFVARPIGSVKVNSADNMHNAPKNIFELLNRPKNSKNPLHVAIENTLSQKDAKIKEAIKNRKTSNDIISFKENGVEYFYEVNPFIKSAFELNTSLPSMLADTAKKFKNIVQTTATGKLNPAFAVPSSIMATHEGLTLLPTLAKKLNLASDDVSKIGYLKEFASSYKNLVADDILINTMRKYNKALIANKGQAEGPLSKYLQKINIEQVQAKLKSSLLTKIKQSGGASAKPYTTNEGIFYTINKDTKLSDKIEQFLLQHDGIDGAVQKIKVFNALQQSLREAPSLALTTYLGKRTGAIVNNEIVNPQKLAEVIDVIGTHTANVGRSGVGSGFIGGTAKFIENYVPYGNVMIKSLAPKIRSSGILQGSKNIYQDIADLYDPNVRYVDILHNMQQQGTDLLKNKFFEGLVATSLIPSTIQYVWNHGSAENMEAYYQLSDYEKASKFILVNFLGKGRHLTLAKDQEVALADTLYTTMLDGIVGMSKYNAVDPAFEQSRLITQSLGRSVGIDSIPALDIISNVSGYDMNLNLFSDDPFVKSLSRNKINTDMSETAYQNGILNQETTALMKSLFTVVGSTLVGAIEEGNVGAQNDTAIQDASQSVFDNMTKSARILTTTKNISSFNQTSKEVYNKQNLINKIASVSDKNPQQQQVYDTVKTYNRNRIKPLHDAITDMRKSINTLKATGRMEDGSVLDYDGRKAEINEMNKKLQKLFAKEYHEFENLDKLLEQMYGKNINLNNFMEKFNGQ